MSKQENRSTILRRELVEKVIERFGFSSMPDPTLETLSKVYKAWSRSVGYDNVQKRVYFANGGKGPFPVADPNDFAEAFLKHNTGGSCWVVAEAYFGILHHIGFDVRRIAGRMLGTPDPMKPNHGSVLVTIDGQDYVADPSMCGEEAVALIDGQATSASSKAHGIWSPGDGRYWWKPGHSRTPIENVIEHDNCSYAFFLERYEMTKQFSLFNDVLYARVNDDDGILTIGRGNLIRVDNEGEMTAQPLALDEIKEVLINRMGMSEEIVSQIPPDSEGETFGST